MSDSELIRLVPSLLWFSLVLAVIALFWRGIGQLIEALASQIHRGASVSVAGVNFRGVPREVRSGAAREATAEGPKGAPVEDTIEEMIEKQMYPGEFASDLFIVHEAQVLAPPAPGRAGSFRVRAFLEGDTPRALDSVKRVTYRLHETFREKKVIATQARDRSFELWLTVYGEFNLIAFIERENTAPFVLSRYLDLPGRPTD